MAYVPDPTDASQPVESVLAQTAAAEFRALKAYLATIVSGGGLGVSTPGQIVYFPGNTPLPGWLEADGSLVSRTTYAALWAAAQALGSVVLEAAWNSSSFGNFSSGDLSTNFRLPDLRGIFIRTWSHSKVNSSMDPGRAIGTYQTATVINNSGGASGTVVVPFTGQSVQSGDEAFSLSNSYNVVAGSGGTSLQSQASVRPTNLALMACIKT